MLSFWKRDSAKQVAEEKALKSLDAMRERLQARLGHKPTPVKLDVDQLTFLNKAVRRVLRRQPMLIEVEPPVKIVGDTHGQFYDLLRLFDFCGDPRTTSYVFMGDYVDRGQLSLESLCLLFAFKIKYPETFWLLRGNHESAQITQIYGFYDECRKRFGARLGEDVWEDFCTTFNYLPVAGVVGGRILCVHGGISPDLKSLDQIRRLPRPSEIADYGLMCDLLWSDPDPSHRAGWCENPRGISFTFGSDPIKAACERLGLDLIVRGHQMVRDGYKFTAGRRMLTIFSAPKYCPKTKNAAGILDVDKNLLCSIEIMRPDETLEFVYIADRKSKSEKRESLSEDDSIHL